MKFFERCCSPKSSTFLTRREPVPPPALPMPSPTVIAYAVLDETFLTVEAALATVRHVTLIACEQISAAEKREKARQADDAYYDFFKQLNGSR